MTGKEKARGTGSVFGSFVRTGTYAPIALPVAANSIINGAASVITARFPSMLMKYIRNPKAGITVITISNTLNKYFDKMISPDLKGDALSKYTLSRSSTKLSIDVMLAI